jgi:aryl-alcohol dehydrogenase-like predicted oxidoreductase
MFGVGAIPWSPLARGFLTRPFQQSKTKREENDAGNRLYVPVSADSQNIIERYVTAPPDHANAEVSYSSVEQVAKSRGVSMAQISVAWMLSKDGPSL